jgi:hypothetical protein
VHVSTTISSSASRSMRSSDRKAGMMPVTRRLRRHESRQLAHQAQAAGTVNEADALRRRRRAAGGAAA